MSELKDKELEDGKNRRGVSALTRLLCVFLLLIVAIACENNVQKGWDKFKKGDLAIHKLTGDTLIIAEKTSMPDIVWVRNKNYKGIKLGIEELIKLEE